jgi:hypothetical protein
MDNQTVICYNEFDKKFSKFNLKRGICRVSSNFFADFMSGLCKEHHFREGNKLES